MYFRFSPPSKHVGSAGKDIFRSQGTQHLQELLSKSSSQRAIFHTSSFAHWNFESWVEVIESIPKLCTQDNEANIPIWHGGVSMPGNLIRAVRNLANQLKSNQKLAQTLAFLRLFPFYGIKKERAGGHGQGPLSRCLEHSLLWSTACLEAEQV